MANIAKMRGAIAVAMSLALCSQSFAQTALPTQDDQLSSIVHMYPAPGAGCNTSTVVTYDARGFWFPGSIRVCQHGIDDVSAGDYAPAPGQRLFFTNGRGKRGSLYSLVRGYPNTPYQFARTEYGYESHYADRPTTFGDMVVTLPFVPYGIREFDLLGITRYAFTDLRILPGMEAKAYPLNRNSVIVRVDGYFFTTPDAWMSMMRYPHEDNPYMEVEYVQIGETPQTLRSVFIPLVPISQAGASWQALSGGSHIGEVDSFGRYVGIAGALFALAAIWYGVESSGWGDVLRDQSEQCHRRQRMSPAPIFC